MAGQFVTRSRKRNRRHGQFSEINVTPFVDVMLVLLIVFMVSAPLLSTGVAVDLPKSKAGALSEEDSKPIEISLTQDGELFIGETTVKRDRLIALLSAMTERNLERRIYIRASENLPYKQVMDILGAVNGAGFKKVALVSKPAAFTP